MKTCAPAKINLSLVVGEKRKDKFHEIETIFQTITLFDKIEISPSETLTVSCLSIPEKENIVYKAGIALLKYTGQKYGARIAIKKHIPISSGLGGGSSDCAETLLALNKFWGLSLSKDELKKIGETLGADVPFFFEKGTGQGIGKGEKITPLISIPSCFFLLVFFPFKVSTKEVYESFIPQKRNYDVKSLILAIEEGNLFDIAKNLYNDLESVTIKKHPIIQETKEYLVKEGALNALMTGSGPTIFGIFERQKDALLVKKSLPYPGIKAKIVKPLLG